MIVLISVVFRITPITHLRPLFKVAALFLINLKIIQIQSVSVYSESSKIKLIVIALVVLK